MRHFTTSEMYELMNRNNAITAQLKVAGSAVGNGTIINDVLDSLEAFKRTYRETIGAQVLNAIAKKEILLVVLPTDKRFPANIPFMKTAGGKPVEIVDVSKYARIEADDDGKIMSVHVDIDKLYAILVPAYLDLKLFSPSVALPSESIKLVSLMWAKMFNKILQAKKIFIGNQERYEAFMYFAMRFYMKYYIQCPEALVEKLSMDYIGGVKSKYITFVENNLDRLDIDLYENWTTFAATMFNNEVTNLNAFNSSGTSMDVRLYLQSFDMYMGKDGAFVSLWSVPYFIYCLFATYQRANILNDRAWQDIVLDDKRMIPKLMESLYKEL